MPVINKPLLYANTATWNGSGTATVTVDFGFQPDLVWIKPRNNVASNANSHILIDSVRGSDKVLRSQTTGAEVTESNNITAFTSTGITIGNSHNVNKNTASQYVAWAWKKGATQGFDIVTYTGTGSNTTVAHNLGVAPSFMIVKARSSAGYDWRCYHSALGATKYIDLQTTSAAGTASTVWQDTAPTSSVFSVGTNGSVNANTVTFVAYLFSQITGFSRFGSYTGNGSADGPFVFCGFRPRWVLIKDTTTTPTVTEWGIFDAARDGDNVLDSSLFAHSSAAETTGTARIDFTANGFKIRNTGFLNTSSANLIFAAFAENPFKNALAR